MADLSEGVLMGDIARSPALFGVPFIVPSSTDWSTVSTASLGVAPNMPTIEALKPPKKVCLPSPLAVFTVSWSTLYSFGLP